MFLHVFSSENSTSIISRNLEGEHLRLSHMFPLCISLSQMELRESGSTSGCCQCKALCSSCFGLALHTQFFSGILQSLNYYQLLVLKSLNTIKRLDSFLNKIFTKYFLSAMGSPGHDNLQSSWG